MAISPKLGVEATGTLSNEALASIALTEDNVKDIVKTALQGDDTKSFIQKMGPFMNRQEVLTALPKFLAEYGKTDVMRKNEAAPNMRKVTEQILAQAKAKYS
ncbi:MAG: hypothetical protein ABI758_04195 [Candidatus Woesebacteria bacterium]